MELDIGKHCSECRQLDFCPTQCDKCKKFFCSQHYSLSNHNCIEIKEKKVKCPLCKKLFTLHKDEDPNIKINNHITNSCRITHPSKLCSKKKCKKKCLESVKCFRCNKNFCLEHRFPDTHNCIRV